ncbi:MAG: MFS transporter [Proteiniphilum sp.]|uniref:MFS transporter n=1 Tax=Proteiniphilum sp. TaxID=1926877 RepID=UPI002B2126E5|nr:MFS transporter [Proteiniphilum sp.]MEA5128729.1 MFS transporter [Proteiniphilum sp.]
MNKERNQKRALWIVIAIVLLNSIGMTIVLPLLPFLVGQYLPESQVVVGMGALMSVFAACTFFAAPVLGALSDRYGRKKILIASLLGSMVGYIFLGIGGTLWILFLGRIIDGLTAGNISALFAYISDSTKPEERTKWFGYIGAATGVGFMGGPAFGGWLGSISISLPFFVTALLIFLSALCTLLFLPESLAVENRSKQLSLKNMDIIANFKDIFSLKEVQRLLVLGAFFAIALGIYQNNVTIFLKDIFHWGPALIGSILAWVGACDILSRAVLLPLLLKKFSERAVGIAGLICLSLGLGAIFLTAYFPLGYLIIIAVVLITIGEGLFDPSFNGNLSKSVDDSQQGKLQGVNQSLQSIYRVLVPLAVAAIYMYSPAFLYVIATMIAVCALFLFSRLKQLQID